MEGIGEIRARDAAWGPVPRDNHGMMPVDRRGSQISLPLNSQRNECFDGYLSGATLTRTRTDH